jgi:protein phosphatase
MVVGEALGTTASSPDSAAAGESGSMFEFDLPLPTEQVTEELTKHVDPAIWPGIAWESNLLLRAAHLSLPRLIDTFTENGFTYLIEEVPTGSSLWDAWDGEGVTNKDRFTWMIQIAQAIERLHIGGAILEGLRPEMIVVSPSGLAILADLTDLLPLPLPVDVPLRGGFSTAPELLLNPGEADERADLYCFGALLYSLLLGHELTDLDFTLTGMPRPYLERVPDANPFLARVMAKTFVRDVSQRFPTDDGSRTDASGIRELIEALDACRRNLDRVRVDVAAWSTTGMVRSGNEDAVVVFHSAENRLDDSDEAVLVLLADGMGGMECGEVAAGMAMQTLRDCLLNGPPFAFALPQTPTPETKPPIDQAPPPENADPFPSSLGATLLIEPPAPPELSPSNTSERSTDSYVERVNAALREANRRIFDAARANPGALGMGCTAEVVLIDGSIAVVGHVGDSRVYRMRGGKIDQITRDHTVVSRLVELGQITAAEAESHPRRSELQQAIGGRPEVYPDVYAMTLAPGDWLVVCTDGLSNQTPSDVMQAVLRDSRSAEKAARRLVNMVLADGATDNVTVAVIRLS